MPIDTDLRSEAADALNWALTLTLPPSRWDEVSGIVAGATQALQSGDEEALREAVGRLDALTRRVERRPGGESLEAARAAQTRAPEKVYARAVDLVHTLTSAPDQRGTS